METETGSFLGVFGERSKLPPVKRVALFLRPKAMQQTTTPKEAVSQFKIGTFKASFRRGFTPKFKK